MYKRGFVIFGVVSLTMGNSALPFGNSLRRNAKLKRKSLLRQPCVPPHRGNIVPYTGDIVPRCFFRHIRHGPPHFLRLRPSVAVINLIMQRTTVYIYSPNKQIVPFFGQAVKISLVVFVVLSIGKRNVLPTNHVRRHKKYQYFEIFSLHRVPDVLYCMRRKPV